MKKFFLIFIFSICLLYFIKAQTITGTCIVLNQPCNNDGVLVTKITSGMTLPLTFYYQQSQWSTTHSKVRAFSDTLRNIQMCTSVYVYDSLNHYLQFKTGMVAPFTIDNPVITNVTCPATKGTAKITVKDGTMPDSVQWFTRSDSTNYPSGTTGGSGKYKGSGNPMSLAPGYYYAQVYYQGCNQSANVYIQYVTPFSVTITTTDANCTNGSASVTKISAGTQPFTYKWSNGATTQAIANLVKGNYTVTVSDAQGCYAVQYAYVKQAITISVTTTVKDATCKQNDGSIIAFASGGKTPYSYLYSNGATTQSINSLSGGTTFTVIATDANGCTGQGYGTLKATTPITVTYNTKPSSCTAATGSAALVIKGGTQPYEVNWNIAPKQSGSSISNMPAGNYSFFITDNVGCVQSGTVTITPVSIINVNPSTVNAVCPNSNGSAHASVSGSNPPFRFLWSNGATGETIMNLSAGTYSCMITDNVNCSVTKTFNVKLSSPVNIGLTSTPASCLYTADGKLFANATGGTAPYSYKWSDGQTGNTAQNLMQGKYYVYAMDSKGCSMSNYAFVGYNEKNDNCYCKIKGKVYVDENNNCQFDAGETGIEHIMLNCSGIGSAFTDANGDYFFLVPTGSHKISENIQYIYPLAPCQSNDITVIDTAKSGCTQIVNFANIINPLNDIHIYTTFINPPVPGFNYTQGFIVQNDGTVKENDIQLDFNHDCQLNYIGASPEVYIQLDPANKPCWWSDTTGFPALKPGEGLLLKRDFLVPVNIPLGTTVTFNDTASFMKPIAKWLDDYTPWNNVNKYQTKIVGSYDPNAIEVKPLGAGPEGYIYVTDSVLDYIVHFQNMGTYYAQNVVITDTLDKNLDWNTLKTGYSNYPYSAELSENGVLKFTFKNINLTWKAQSDLLSRGLVTYTVKQKPELPAMTKIYAKANVYFDFNPPVATNSVLNTIYRYPQTGIVSAKTNKAISIYPNPANSVLNVCAKDIHFRYLNIYDITGRLLIHNIPSGSNVYKLDISSLINGMYFIEATDVNGTIYNSKFLKN